MSDATVLNLGPESESLADYTTGIRKGVSISWYRSPLPPGAMKMLHAKSDVKGGIQTLCWLGIWACTATLALYSFGHWPWWLTGLALFAHGTVASFGMNGVHELGHGTVFKTKWLNVFFCHIFSFLSFINHEMFQTSHTRHHRYTLHPPDDLEVVLPTRVMIKNFFKDGFITFGGFWFNLKFHTRIALGKFRGEWENTLYPAGQPELRVKQIRWARCLLAGHAAIFIASMIMGWWLVPVVVLFSAFYGGALQFLCNNTQHIGLQDKVGDFRLCCRTFTLNRFIQFLYWDMNFHIEHHMFAAVPCYNLKKLHELIKADLPPTPHGLYAVWKEIAEIQAKQDIDPTYQYAAPLPYR